MTLDVSQLEQVTVVQSGPSGFRATALDIGAVVPATKANNLSVTALEVGVVVMVASGTTRRPTVLMTPS